MIAFPQAFRTPDLRKKLLFTLGIIVVFRFGSALPAPGISEPDVRHCSGLASAQIESQLRQHHYEGFLRPAPKKNSWEPQAALRH